MRRDWWAIGSGVVAVVFIMCVASAGSAAVPRVWMVKTIAHDLGGSGVAVDTHLNIYAAAGPKVMKISPDGKITTYAGGGAGTSNKDGLPATSWFLGQIRALAVDRQGNLYIVDGKVVDRVGPDGRISTYVGGHPTGKENGVPANSALLDSPSALAVDKHGNLFIADGERVLKVTAAGIASTIAGANDNRSGNSGDGGPANKALLTGVRGLAVDENGNVYFITRAHQGPNDQRLRKVRADGTITTFAAKPTAAYDAVTVDKQGRVYAQVGHGLSQFSPDGNTATRIAGYGNTRPTDGLAIPNVLGLGALAIDGQGRIYSGDNVNGLVRLLYLAPKKKTVPSSARALKAVAMNIETDLAQLASGRAKLKATLTNAATCSITPAVAAAQVATVIGNRQQVLDQLSRLAAPNAQGTQIITLLRGALTHAIAADRRYQSWLSHVKSGCPLAHDQDYRAAQHEDALATAAKRRFVAAFNPVARAWHLRTWSSTDF